MMIDDETNVTILGVDFGRTNHNICEDNGGKRSAHVTGFTFDDPPGIVES